MFSVWIRAARPRTLVAAVVPVFVGICLALESNLFLLPPAILCMLFAILVQIGANFANDYFDYQKGADTLDRIGPRRAVASGLILPAAMFRATWIILGLAFLVGAGLLPYGGWKLLLVGTVSILCALIYTGGPFPLAYLGLGDFFVVGFFGIVAVGFTHFVQARFFSLNTFLAGLAVGLVVNNLLVVNNYRDVEEDCRSDKKTLAVRFGRKFSLWQFRLQTLGACVCVAWMPTVEFRVWLLLVVIFCLLGTRVSNQLDNAVTTQDFGVCLNTTALMVPVFGAFLGIGILT
ncbi:MAG: 1,4-dihydroxy-2-naphthoate octaprenyltransferase [Opitutales bacterium]|nr:1,4-dihydroxy-2-naphthoate octaprenyltransferase [Opitutales bacterium]